MTRWFLPRTPDVLGLLTEQAATTLEALDSFVAWSGGGDPARVAGLRDAVEKATEQRRRLLTELRAAFSVPLDAEDIYALSERLHAVIRSAKNAVREAEVMAMAPDSAMARMAEHIAAGVRHLVAALGVLTTDEDRATAEADAAIECQRELEHVYRSAMSALLSIGDVRELMGRRELYRRYARTGDAVARVADRVWYAVVKEA